MQQLVIQFPLKNETVELSELDVIAAIESDLERLADGRFDVDGHDVGTGEMNIFIITPDAKVTLEQIHGALPDDRSWCAGFRDLDSEHYQPIAPPGLAAFSVT